MAGMNPIGDKTTAPGTVELTQFTPVSDGLPNATGPGIGLSIKASAKPLGDERIKQLIDAQSSGAFWNGIEKTGIAVGNVIGSILTNYWNSKVVEKKFETEAKVALYNKEVALAHEATTNAAIGADKDIKLAGIQAQKEIIESSQGHKLRLAQVVEGAKTERLQLMQAYGTSRENYNYGNPFSARNG